jgi:hypothetical protein
MTTQTLQITSPSSGATVKGTIVVAVTAVEVGQVNFSVDGKYGGFDSFAPFTFTLDTTRLTDGTHTVGAASANGAVHASVSVTVTNGVTPPPAPPGPAPVPLGALLFTDEFDGPAGSKPDTAKWNVHSGHAGLGLGYWNGLQNVELDGQGNLVVTAVKSGSVWDSAFLTSKPGYKGARYIETRGKPAAGVGTWNGMVWEWDWPYGSNGWELDVVEQLGREPEVNHTTMHKPPRQSGHANPLGVVLADAFHLYGAAVYKDHADFYFDGKLVWTAKASDVGLADLTANEVSACVQLNMGGWGGTPTISGPARMMVDYVRVHALA